MGMIVKVAVVALGQLLLSGTMSGQSPGTTHCRPTLAPRTAGPQVSDTLFDPPIRRPAFPTGTGPTVLLDEGHFNFHTVEGRYAPFVRLLRRDGFVVRPLREPWSPGSLAPARILVMPTPFRNGCRGVRGLSRILRRSARRRSRCWIDGSAAAGACC